MMYYLTVKNPFDDRETGEKIHIGEIFATPDRDRAMDIIRRNLADLKGVFHGIYNGQLDIMIHQKFCYKIGGIETANLNLARAFKDRNMTFVFSSGDFDQLMRLAEYHNVWIDDGRETYDTNVIIMTNYDSAPEILNRVRAKKVYQQIHADFEALTSMNEWRTFVWHPNHRIDRVLTVSETAQKGLQARFGVDSVVVPNILLPVEEVDTKVFLFLSRATPEKGADRLVDLLRRFDEAEKNYILLLCSTIDQANDSNQIYLRENPRVVTVQPTPQSKALIKCCDYLIQLSYNESYCYSVREALSLGKPCIVSDIPELRKLITDGKNGFIYNDDFDIDRLWKTLPKQPLYKEEISPLWEEVLAGKL